MTNHMEQFQDEISKILDDFLEIMKTSTCHIEYESYKENSYCQVNIKLWKTRSCRKHLLETAFFVKRRADLSHLARFLDSVANVFKFFHPQDENDSNWNWIIETVSKECALLLKFIGLVWNYSVSNNLNWECTSQIKGFIVNEIFVVDLFLPIVPSLVGWISRLWILISWDSENQNWKWSWLNKS